MDSIVDKFERFQEDVVLETSDHALSTLSQMVLSETIDLSPQFQRRDRWDAVKQSQLIESFLLNIPVPPLYLAEGRRGLYDVIDGKQRLTAITQFLTNRFSLRGLERFPDVEGQRFSELPPELRGTLNFRPLRTVTLLRQSSPQAKYEVFHRLNSGGQVLNAQEIRNVLYRGPLNDLIYALGEDGFLRAQLKISGQRSPAYRNMTDAEWVLRFFTVRETWRRFSGDFRDSMDLFMSDHSDPGAPTLRRMSDLFIRSIRACESILGSNAFKRPDGSTWRDQALAGVYDAEMVAVAEIGDEELDRVISRRAETAEAIRRLFLDDIEFDQASRQATNTPARVEYRVGRMLALLTSAAA